MKRPIILIIALLVASATLYACELSYTIADSTGTAVNLTPGTVMTLEQGKTYTLTLLFHEDHRNCKVPPEETLFLFDQARWRPGSTTQDLSLAYPASWIQNGSRDNTGTIVFTAIGTGEHTIDVIRECSKGGYTATLAFAIEASAGGV